MFNKSNFCHIASNNRNEQKGSVFIYKTSDSLAQVTESGYFNEKLIDINVHDLIIHVQYNPVDRTLRKSVLIVTERTMDNVETTPILDQTIGDDIDQLGDQVAGIEEKIPGAASAANQLADKAFVNDIKTAIETTIAGINTSISTLNNDLSQTNQNLSQTNQNLSQTNQNLAQTNQDVDSLQETKQDKATAVNYDNITNCITEIPQDIKLELNDGILTLKAGSKVYIPNGSGVFDEVVIPSDIIYQRTGVDTLVLVIQTDTLEIKPTSIQFVSSGNTDPQAGVQHHLWYDTANNVIKKYGSDTQTPAYTSSFPFAIIKVGVDKIESIENIFNGFGYIGSTVFALPGVKGLIPNGRNSDGSLNNIEITTPTIKTMTMASYMAGRNSAILTIFANTELGGMDVNQNTWGTVKKLSDIVRSSYYACYYCLEDNLVHYFNGSGDESIKQLGFVGSFNVDSNNKITQFTSKTIFHAVDYSDTEFISHQAMPSDKYIDLPLGASGAIYTAPADGWFFLNKKSGISDGWMAMENTNGLIGCITSAPTANNSMTVSVPVKKGDIVSVSYTFSGPTNTFRFIYANGAK